jgi:hypothetical protein
MRMLRDELSDLTGRVDRYLAQINQSAIAGGNQLAERLATVRQNADIRAELIKLAYATPEELDEAGLWSHEQLDQLDEQGKLTESLMEGRLVRRSAGGIAARFKELLHPRDRDGKWIDKPDLPSSVKSKPSKAPDLSAAESKLFTSANPSLLDKLKDGEGPVEKKLRKALDAIGIDPYDVNWDELEVHADGHEAAPQSRLEIGGQGISPCAQARSVDFSVHVLLPEMLREKYPALSEKLRRTSPRWGRLTGQMETGIGQPSSPEPPKSKFQQRVEKLDADATKLAGEGVKEIAAEQGMAPNNPGFGRTSQSALLTYVREAATQPRTVELYSEVKQLDDGSSVRVYDESRRALHEQIITSMLDGIPGQEQPRVLFSGGGYAAGKGSVLKLMAAKGDERLPPDALVLDPDRIKAMLPEFADQLGSDPQANLLVYEEAWDIAQEVQRRAQERKMNVIVDGISDTSPEEMLGRVDSFTDSGYSAHAVYVSIPTETANQRGYDRAINATDEAARRFIPQVIMRAVHRDVSATLPGVLEGAPKRGLTVDVYDNDVERGAEPIHVLKMEEGKPKVLDGQDETWAAILAKGKERIPGVDERRRGVDAYGKVKKEGEL